MAYTAKVNGVTFFKTNSDDPALALSEAKVKLGANSAGTFDFTVPRTNTKFNQFTRYRSYIDVYRDGEELSIFSGRVISIGSGFDTFEKICCEGALTYLSDSYFRPITHEGNLHSLLAMIMNSHNSQVEADKQILLGEIEIPDSNCYRAYENIETTLSRIKDLNESFGGYIQVRKAANGSLYLDWHRLYDDGNPQAIKLGSNLLNISIDDNDTDLCTVLIPLGARDGDGNYLTIKEVNNNRDYIVADQQYLNAYGYITKVEHFDDITEAANLLTKARANLLARLTRKITIEANAVDLADANEVGVNYFSVGQLLKVKSHIHGVDDFFECREQEIDLLHPDNNTLTLGGTKVNYIQTHSEQNVSLLIEQLTRKYMTQSLVEAAIENATKKITGNQGGYIVLNDANEDGEPDELLCMDTPDIETAVKIWRLNNSGFGYSNHGYDGPYALAMTMDGAIVANMITSGVLNANIIRAGRIQSVSGGAYWDLDTGELNILAGSVQGLSAVATSGRASDISGLSTVATSGRYSDLSGKPTIPSLQGYIKEDGRIGAVPSEGATGFVVSSAGLLQASNAVIFGEIYASAGTVGGLKIETNSIHSNGYAVTSNASGSVALSSVDFTRSITDIGSKSDLRLAIGDGFGVSKTGVVYASSAVISGTVYASAGTIGGLKIETNSIHSNGYAVTSNADGSVALSSANFSRDISYIGTISGLRLAIGSSFGVTNSGVTYTSTLRTYQVRGSTDTTHVQIPYLQSTNSIKAENIASTAWTTNNSFTLNRYALFSNTKASTSDWASGGSDSISFFTNGMDSYTRNISSASVDCVLYVKGGLGVSSGGWTYCTSFFASGNKSRLMNTENYDERLLYCYEMPSPMFGDIGEGDLDDDGLCYISIDDIFSETIYDGKYQVFIQKESAGDIWVKEKSRYYFIVEGTPNMHFSWEIKAKQIDYPTERLENHKIISENFDCDLYVVQEDESLSLEFEQYISEQEDMLYETA